MTFLKLTTVVLLLLLGQSLAQIERTGQCQDVTVVEDFNLTEYLGVWYEIQRYDAEFQVSLDCTTAEYLLANPNEARVTVVNSGLLFNGPNATFFEVRGVAVPSFPEDDRNIAKLSVAFFGAEPDRSNYWVLGTDYHSYSLVWSCEQLTSNTYNEYAWVLSRTKEVTPEANARINALIAENGIATADFRVTEQTERCLTGLVPF